MPGTPEYLTNAFADRIQALRTQDTGTWPLGPHPGSDRNWGSMIGCREGGKMWYKPWESDVVKAATQAPAAAKLTAQILKSVGADGDGGNGYGVASNILAMASAASNQREPLLVIDGCVRAVELSEGVMMKEPFDGGMRFANNSVSPAGPSPVRKGALRRRDGRMAGGGWHFPDGGPGRVLGRPGVARVEQQRAEMSPDDAAKEPATSS